MAQDEGSDSMSHDLGVKKGEEMPGEEEGLEETGTDDAGRPTSTRTARSSTGVNAEGEEPIDPEMPNMPPA